MKKCLVAALAAVSGSWVFAATPETTVEHPTFALPKMSVAPKIDGVLDEAEWKDATQVLQFIPLHSDTVFPGEARVLFGRDEKNFYIGARMIVSPYGLVKGPPPPARRGNGGMLGAFNGDCFEIDFTSDKTAAKESVVHMIVSSTGCYYSTGSSKALPIAWDPPSFKTASSERDGFWTFEYSIPLAEIFFKPEEAAVHAVRIARDWKFLNSSGFGIQSSVAPWETSFEKAGCCMLTPFIDDAPVVKHLEIGLHGHQGDEGVQSYPVKLSIRNTAKEPRAFKVRLFGKPVNSQPMLTEQTVTVGAGEEKVIEDRGAVLSDEKVFLRMTVASADGKTLYYDRSFNFQPGFSKIAWMRRDAKGPEITMLHAYFPSFDKMRVRADLSPDKKNGRNADVTFSILRKDGKVVTTYATKADEKGIVDVIFPTGDLAAETKSYGVGEYRLVMNAPKVAGGSKTNAFLREVFDWEGNKLGLSSVIPAPFTAVKREKIGQRSEVEGQTAELEKVSVILRDHIVDTKSGLWAQVKAAGKDVLARPIALVAAAGRPAVGPYLAESVEWDVDGLNVWTLTLKPGHYEPFSLEIPVKAERAPLMHSCTDGIRITYAGCVPAGQGVVWKSSQVPHVGIIGDYVPYIWVGGTLRGISVFGENDKGWVLGEEKKVGGESRSTADGKIPLSTSTSSLLSYSRPHQEIIREKDGTVVIRLNLVQRAVDLTEPRTIRLGFMATPTKPMEENWRAHDPGTFYGSGKCWGCGQTDSDVCPWDGTDVFWQKLAATRRTGRIDEAFLKDTYAKFPYAGAPGSKDRANWMERVQRHFRSGFENVRRNAGKRPITWYTNARGVDFSTKQGQTFCDEWNRQEWMGHDFNILSHRDYDLDPCKSFRDYAAWWYAKAVSIGVVENYYWDDIYLCPNCNLVGTDAYRLEDGTIQPSTGIFNMRALVKRCAMVQAELGRPCRGNWVHMTSTAIAPILSFAGLNYDLEDGGSVNDFQDRYGRDYMLACTIGRQHGNFVSAMGYFGKTSAEERKRLDRCGTGVMLVYEIMWTHSGTWRAWDKKMREWGYRSNPEVKVWNDFDEDVAYPVALSGVPVASIAMVKKVKGEGQGQGGGTEALIILSDAAEGGAVTVKPDCATLGIPAAFKAFDFETGAEIPVKDGAFTVSNRKHDFTVVTLR